MSWDSLGTVASLPPACPPTPGSICSLRAQVQPSPGLPSSPSSLGGFSLFLQVVSLQLREGLRHLPPRGPTQKLGNMIPASP